MPGSNATGTANTNDYGLFRGILKFSAIDATTGLPSGGFRDMGNAPEFSFTITSQVLDHYSSRAGVKSLDKEVVISQDCEVKFKLDEINFENLALWTSGDQNAATNAAIAGFTTWVMVPNTKLALGRYYEVRNSSGVRAYDITPGVNLTITTAQTSPVAMVEGTDYTFDRRNGTIFILSTSTVAAASIAESGGKGLNVALAASAGATVTQQVNGLTTTTIEGALKFEGVNAAYSDDPIVIDFHKVKVTADGDFSLIGDTIAEMSFKGKATKNTGTAFGSGKTMTITYPGNT